MNQTLMSGLPLRREPFFLVHIFVTNFHLPCRWSMSLIPAAVQYLRISKSLRVLDGFLTGSCYHIAMPSVAHLYFCLFIVLRGPRNCSVAIWGALALIRRVSPLKLLKLLKLFHLLLASVDSCFYLLRFSELLSRSDD